MQVQASPSKRNAPERWFKPLIWGSSSRSVFSFGQLASYILHLTRPQGPPRCVYAFFGQGGFQSKSWLEDDLDLLWFGIPFLSDPKGSLCVYITRVSLILRMRSDLLVFCPSRAQPLFWSHHYHHLTCPQKTSTNYLPCAYCYFSPEVYKQVAGNKCLFRSPKKYKQEAICKCLCWSPSISFLSVSWLPWPKEERL